MSGKNAKVSQQVVLVSALCVPGNDDIQSFLILTRTRSASPLAPLDILIYSRRVTRKVFLGRKFRGAPRTSSAQPNPVYLTRGHDLFSGKLGSVCGCSRSNFANDDYAYDGGLELVFVQS